VDVRSLAAILFAFVVVVVFGGFVSIAVLCRVTAAACLGSSPVAADTIKSLTENIIAILLALMAGTAGRPPPPPPPPP
jgi:hypothetical protein